MTPPQGTRACVTLNTATVQLSRHERMRLRKRALLRVDETQNTVPSLMIWIGGAQVSGRSFFATALPAFQVPPSSICGGEWRTQNLTHVRQLQWWR